MTQSEILAHVDHTLLKPEASWQQIKTLCDEAVLYKTASVCINPVYAADAVSYLAGRVPVCTVIGFPLGATTQRDKIAQTEFALADGCAEFDMVISIGKLKEGKFDAVQAEIKALKQTVGDKVLKVIIETCLLTQLEKEKMCEIVCNAGADYIKTSTGFSSAGATFEDIALFAKCVAGRCKIKAAGGISSVADMQQFLDLGADRLGTSRAIQLFQNL